MGVVNALSVILATRMLVLVSIGGAIGLTWLGLTNPDPYRLIALGIYCFAVVIPCIYLGTLGR
jgi:hypothetical protein